MADVKISELPAVTTINAGTDVLPLVSLDGGSTLTTYKSTAQQTMNAALAAPGPIGAGTANTGAFTTLSASSTVSGTGFSTYLASPPAIGGTAPAAGSFTNVSASGTVSGTGFSSYLASPPAIGGTAAAAGSFTNLSASGTVSGTGITNLLASPPAIGGTAAAAGSFTTLSGSTSVTSPIVKADSSAGGVLQSNNATQCMQWGAGGGANVTISGGLTASGTVSGTGFSDYLASPPAIGGTAAAAGSFTTLSASSTVSGTGFSNYLASPPAIGGTAAAAGSFTTLSASSTVSGTGFSDYLASPPAIGGTAAAAGSFTTLSASSNVTLSGGTANGVVYLDGSKVATSGSAIVFDGSNLGIGTNSPGFKLHVTTGSSGNIANFTDGVAQSLVFKTNATSFIFDESNGGDIVFAQSNVQKMSLSATGLDISGVVSTAGYTVATLPSGIPTGSRAYVTDALTPVVLTAVAGGGAVVVPVFYDGTNWIVG